MQQFVPFLLHLFPGDSLYPAGVNVMQTASDLYLPGGIHIFIDGCVQTGDQVPSQFSSFLVREGQSLPQQFLGFLRHPQNYIPHCNLIEETLGFDRTRPCGADTLVHRPYPKSSF
jgi:hypothetical protein